MGELVIIKRQNKEEVPVTTSRLVAEKTKNTHSSVQRLISNHILSLENFGRVGFEIVPLETKGGIQDTKIYFLNEQQSTLLVTFMRNNKTVIDFKVELVKQFYAMRQLLLEKQTQEWQEARQIGKSYTKELNDSIKVFVEYATMQGSSKPTMYYIHFAKLINKAVGITNGQRDMTTKRQLRNQTFLMELIEATIKENMDRQVNYKEIFSICKTKVNGFLQYIPALRLAQ